MTRRPPKLDAATRLTTSRCQRLDMDGKRCRKPARWLVEYHGDHEIYGSYDSARVAWVVASFCDNCIEGADRYGNRRAKA